MMYSDKLAIAVKVNGKVLREFKDTAFVPFGSEYSLLIKNLNSVRCRVSISIDGKDIADGDSFIVNANSSMEIERFLKNGNKYKGNRFKFIERTANVEAHRGGAQVEDGIIRVEFEFERENTPLKNYYNVPYVHPVPYVPYAPYNPPFYGIIGCASGGLSAGSGLPQNSAGNLNTLNDGHAVNVNLCSASMSDAPATSMSFTSTISGSTGIGGAGVRARGFVADSNEDMCRTETIVNEAGVTAAGSISNQSFITVSDIYGDGVKHVMVVRLLGELGQQKVTKPVTVSARPKCTSCGRTNKATSKFCVECGTSLEII